MTCPTCGSPVRIEGDTTKYYVPLEISAKNYQKLMQDCDLSQLRDQVANLEFLLEGMTKERDAAMITMTKMSDSTKDLINERDRFRSRCERLREALTKISQSFVNVDRGLAKILENRRKRAALKAVSGD